LPDSNLSQTLYTIAEAYLALSYSVIPVWGEADPARPKVAGVEWSIFQRRPPTLTEIQKWFLKDGFGGIAIVTGNISRLAVLDFDTPEGFREFSMQYPELVETQVIQTRRGYHVYFYLPPHLHLPSRKGQGIDLLAAGRYVVARPTSIDGHVYKLIWGGQPKTLTQFDVDSINRFIGNRASDLALLAPEREFRASSFDSSGIEQSYRQPQTPVEATSDLRGLYRYMIEKGSGRNEALFQVSIKARDEGWGADHVIALLADTHVWQAASQSHRSDTPAYRYQETHKTVQSAFSRPPRRREHISHNDYAFLPNTVREKLFSLGETRIVRLLDGLRLKGIKPGEVFTTAQAVELLKGIVGRDSIYTALKALTSAGEPIFKRQDPSPLNPLAPAYAATNTKIENNKCFVVRGKKPGISPNHRPATLYIMPSNDDLCLYLDVKPSRSDPVTLDDLSTAKQTRQAVHRELIRRRPGIYPRRWLARRLGVSSTTLDAYNDEIEGLHSRPCFWEQPIYWSNLNAVPDGIEVNGAVLVDQMGKRYPAQRSIAARLLGQGKRVIYKRQDANYYWYGEKLPELNVRVGKVQNEHKLEPMPQPVKPSIGVYNAAITREPTTLVDTYPQDTPQQRDQHPKINKQDQQPGSKLNYRKPLPDALQEALALKVYDLLNTKKVTAKLISQVTARRLVDIYGIPAVDQAMGLLAKRKHIDQPVGFVMAILKSQATLSRLKSRQI
jgi:hypothetical protein